MSSHFEVIYETGAMSVVDASDREDCIAGLRAHHERATKGQPGYMGPLAPGEGRRPAERIVKVLEYDAHPDDLSAPTAMSVDSALKHLTSVVKATADENGVVDLFRVSQAVVPSPINPNAAPHESKYRAKEAADVTVEVLG